jgi:hypothetical protein
MKTTTITTFVAAMLTVSLLFACKKEESTPLPPACSINMTNLAGSYKIAGLTYQSSAGSQPVDYLATLDDCEKDDILVLKADGNYAFNDAGTVCSPASTETGTWKLEGNILTSNGKLSGTITSFDCKTMVYVVENIMKPGDKYTYKMVKE